MREINDDPNNVFGIMCLMDQLEILKSISRKYLDVWEVEHLDFCRTIAGGC